MTAGHLRHKIDPGKTGDRVAHPGPAAAPPGADEKAGGVRPVVSQMDQARADKPPRPDRDGAVTLSGDWRLCTRSLDLSFWEPWQAHSLWRRIGRRPETHRPAKRFVDAHVLSQARRLAVLLRATPAKGITRRMRGAQEKCTDVQPYVPKGVRTLSEAPLIMTKEQEFSCGTSSLRSPQSSQVLSVRGGWQVPPLWLRHRTLMCAMPDLNPCRTLPKSGTWSMKRATSPFPRATPRVDTEARIAGAGWTGARHSVKRSVTAGRSAGSRNRGYALSLFDAPDFQAAQTPPPAHLGPARDLHGRTASPPLPEGLSLNTGPATDFGSFRNGTSPGGYCHVSRHTEFSGRAHARSVKQGRSAKQRTFRSRRR